MKSVKKEWFSLLIIVMLFVLCYFVPYIHDDWAWGSSIGIDRLHGWFAGKDGRYVSNLLVILLTRVRVLKAFTMTLCLFGIVKLIKIIVNKENNMVSYLSILLLLLIPTRNSAEGILWATGFCVYVPPVVLLLIYLYMNKDVCDGIEMKSNFITIFFLLLLGFVSCLFIEHVTILNIVLGISVFIYYLIKNKKINYASLSYMVGTIIGTIVMFSNSAYSKISDGTSQYSYEKNMIWGAFNQYFNGFYDFFINNNKFLNLIYFILLSLLVIKWRKKKHKKNYKLLLNSCLFIIISYITYLMFSTFISNSNIFYHELYKNYVLGIGSGLFFVSSFIISVICIEDKRARFRTIVCYCILIVVGAPLLVISPLGGRQFVPTYVIFVLIVAILLNYLNIKLVSICNIMKVSIISLFGIYLLIFSLVYIIDRERVQYAKSFRITEDNDVLYVPSFPCEEFMHASSPRNPEFQRRFKLYYHVDMDAKIKVVSYREWKKLINTQ